MQVHVENMQVLVKIMQALVEKYAELQLPQVARARGACCGPMLAEQAFRPATLREAAHAHRSEMQPRRLKGHVQYDWPGMQCIAYGQSITC